jgi:Rieske Fe-S protein
MSRVPYNTQNPNKNFYTQFVEKFTNNPSVTVTDSEFIVGDKKLTRTCPHNGCRLNYNNSQDQFVCPCHASKFNLNGDCLSGPACPNNIRK